MTNFPKEDFQSLNQIQNPQQQSTAKQRLAAVILAIAAVTSGISGCVKENHYVAVNSAERFRSGEVLKIDINTKVPTSLEDPNVVEVLKIARKLKGEALTPDDEQKVLEVVKTYIVSVQKTPGVSAEIHPGILADEALNDNSLHGAVKGLPEVK